MPRFQMDDSLCNDPAVIRAGTAAFGLYARCGNYVAQQLLDGLVPSEVATQWGTPEWVSKLVAVGLWETVPGGWRMPRYLDDNPSREKVLADRAAKAERQKKWLEKKANGGPKPRRTNRPSRDASQDASLTPPVDPPLPPTFQVGRGDAPPPEPGAAARPGSQPAAEVHRNGSARQDSKSVAEALGTDPHQRPRRSESAYEDGPALARRLLAEKRQPP